MQLAFCAMAVHVASATTRVARAPPRGAAAARSSAWIRPFFLVNGFVVALSLVVRRLEAFFAPVVGFYGACVVACAARDACVVLFLDAATRGRRRLGGRAPPSAAAVADGWRRLFFVAAPVDAAVLVVARARRWVVAAPWFGLPPAAAPVAFILVSFVFEVVFDFFHYGAHRASHACAAARSARRPGAVRALAAFVGRGHATHHRCTALAPVLAYEQSLSDVLLCNALPALLALGACAAAGAAVDDAALALLWTYKAYVEAAGHAGCESRATSFPQCVWLPRALGIDLRTIDHDAHHARRAANGCNFAKRFTLWDRAFGTYAAPGDKGS